ncbi:MAG: hypothetical protein B7733_25130 [Myxococcales bacterium FL481]|nr:MAG: hypothetical protein B7733_25130 [Myxococcales bacterium FL481]
MASLSPRCGRFSVAAWLRRWLACGAAVAWALLPALTHASWLTVALPRVEDGPGIRVGDHSRFHPGVAIGVGYDTNVFSSGRPLAVRGSPFVLPSVWLGIGNRRVRGGLLDSPVAATGRLVDYHVGLVGGYRVYLSRRDTVRGAGKPNIGGRLRLTVAPGRRFSLMLRADIDRLGEPRNFEAAREFNFNRIQTSAALDGVLRPGAGRLSLRAGYVNDSLYFLSELATADRFVHGFQHESKWRIRDRSAVVVRYRWQWTYYLCCAEAGSGRNEDSRAHRVWGGYVGQFGKRAELEALAGYGLARYPYDINGPNFSKVLGRLGFSYYPSPRTRLHVAGGQRFQDALFGNYHTVVGGELFVSQQFRWKMQAELGGGIYDRRTSGLPVPGRETDTVVRYDDETMEKYQRRDMLYSTTFKLEQRLGKFLVLGLNYMLNVDDTAFVIYYENGFVAPGRFTRQQIMLITAARL